MGELRRILRSKIHRATVTDADLDYEGSITIPAELMDAAGIAEYEAVEVWNVTNGNRFETYAIKGNPGCPELRINGAAAHLATFRDIIIIACFGYFTEAEMALHKPSIVYVDELNRIRS